jgi:hypothetical protein
MVNYNNAKIYKLVNLDLGLTYYGSTCCGLVKRFGKHKCRAKANTAKCTSSLLFEHGVCNIFLVELYPTDDKTLLHQRERYWIENNECVNKVIPCRSDKEYYVDIRDEILKRKKEYYNANKEEKRIYRANNREQILKQKKIYRLENSDKIKERNRIYRANNKDKIKEQRRIYRLQNRDKINQQQKIRRAKMKLEQSLKTN